MSRLFTAFVLVAGLATASPCLAEPKWSILHDGALTVIGDQSPSTLRDIAVQIGQFRAVVGGLIRNANQPLSKPIVVFVLGDHKGMSPLLPLYKGQPAHIGGYFGDNADLGVIVMSVEGFEESSRITYHEYTHLLIKNAVRALPLWLDEGLAEYYSSYQLVDHGKAADVGRAVAPHILLLRESYVPLAQLIAVDQSSPMYNEGLRQSIFYAESWALTHYLMLEKPGGTAAINKYSAAVAAGQPPSQAFTNAFGASPAEFDKQLQEYVHRRSYSQIRFPFSEKLTLPPPPAAQPMTASEVDAWIGDAQRRAGRVSEAAPRIERGVASKPDAAIAQLALGLLRLSQDRASEALPAFDRAAALGPDDFLTQYVSGVSRLRAEPTESGASRTEAIAMLTRAVALNRASSDGYAALALAQMMSPATLGAARASIERAINLADGRLDYRVRFADIRLLQGDVDVARTILTAIAAITTDKETSRAAAMRLEAIAGYEAPASTSTPERGSAPAASTEPASQAERIRPKTSITRGDFRMRAPQAGESQTFGTLRSIECTAASVRFTVESEGRTLVVAASRMEDVDLVSFINDKDFALSCGPRVSSDRVYLTWRPDTKWGSQSVGTAVALEFVPASHVP